MSRPAGFLLAVLFFSSCSSDVTEFEQPVSPARETYGVCAVCHSDVANRLYDNGGHGSLRIKCERCHEQLLEIDAGPGHRSVPACADCHDEQMTHEDPEAGTKAECLVCHTPHGSPNLALIRQTIITPDGTASPIEFTNLEGVADGGFASASEPGTGLCEVCHSTTRFYPNNGMGEEHFTFTCFTCHPHSIGFAPQ